MRFEIKDRVIQTGDTTPLLGTQGENNIEEVEFTIDKRVGEADLSADGTKCMLCYLSGTEKDVQRKFLDFSELDENTMIAKWSVGREETQSVGLLYVAIHFCTVFDNVLRTKLAAFEVANTINVESPQPVLFRSRMARSVMDGLQPEPEAINILGNKPIIPASLQPLAVQGDNLSKLIPIKMSRIYSGDDLSKYPISLIVTTSAGGMTILLMQELTADEITMMWSVKRPVTSYAGKISIQIQVGNVVTDTFYKITEIATLTISPSLEYEPIVPVSPPEFLEYLAQIQTIEALAQAAKDTAVTKADEASASATEAENSATKAAESVEAAIEASANPPHIGADGYWYVFDVRAGAFVKTDVFAKGDKGEQGTQGLQGPQGEKGPKGEQGEQGIQGASGVQGTQGEKGLQGERGEQGLQGIQGVQGTKGDKGDKGDTGDKGDKGDKGEPLHVAGSFGTLEELNAAHPNGDGENSYVIGISIYVWDGTVWKPTGGISDYADITGKPQIGGVLLEAGNNSLEKLGLYGRAEVDAKVSLLNENIRQLDAKYTVEVGTTTINNSKAYPFNNSEATVSLTTPRNALDYTVDTEVVSAVGCVGEVEVYDKQLNGFKIRFAGSGTQAVIKYYVEGGLIR